MYKLYIKSILTDFLTEYFKQMKKLTKTFKIDMLVSLIQKSMCDQKIVIFDCNL